MPSAPRQTETDNGIDAEDMNARISLSPHTRLACEEIEDVVISVEDGRYDEYTGTSVGVVVSNPTAAKGTIYRNSEVDYDTYETAVGAKMQSDDLDQNVSSTDFKLADPEDDMTTEKSYDGTVRAIEVGSGSFDAEVVDSFDVDTAIIWFNRVSGQVIGRALDFNGIPFARYTDDGYLVKGLLDVPLGWRSQDRNAPVDDPGSQAARRTLAKDDGFGRPPRWARPIVQRADTVGESVFFEVERSGQSYITNAYFNDFEGDNVEEATPIEPRYEAEADDILAEVFEDTTPEGIYALYHGEGWQNDLGDNSDAEAATSGAGSFDIAPEDDEAASTAEQDGLTDAEEQFAERVVETIAGSNRTPDEALKQGFEGTIGANAEMFEGTPNTEGVREHIYENSEHLDAESMSLTEEAEEALAA